MISELGGRVVAIEPQPACHLILKDKLTCFQSAQIVEMAVGSEEGSTEMMLAEEGSQISSLSKEWVETVKRTNRFSGHSWESKINVPVTTLDVLIKEYGIPTFCQIDVEGYEK